MTFSAESPKIERLLLIVALIFIIIVAVKMTADIVNLLLMSVVLTLLALPARDWLKKKGCPDFAAVLIITCAAGLIILMIILLTFMSFHMLVSDIPLYQNELNMRLTDVASLLQTYGITKGMISTPSINLSNVITMVLSSAMSLSDSIMFFVFVCVTTFFMLLEAPKLATRLEHLFGKDSETLQQASRMTGYIVDFIVVRTETNFIHGILFGGFLWVMGVHAAILWGVLTFILCYIPFIGLVIAAIPAAFFAWLQFGVPGALAVIGAVLVLNIIIENPVYSYLASRKFEISALLVILSVVIWGWLLGLIGLLFSVPITLMLLLVFQMCDETRWINRLFGVSHLFEDGSTAIKTGDKEPDED